MPTGTAFFGASNTTSLTIAAPTTEGGLTFNAGAPAYSISTGTSTSLTFNGAGIVNNSSSAPNLLIGIISNLNFTNSATAGNANITVNANNFSAAALFSNSSTAGNATITNTNLGFTTFNDNSTAGNATIININRGFTSFLGNSTAGNATILAAAGGSVLFSNSASGGMARLIAGAGGVIDFSALGSGTTAGSIEGAGTYALGANQLTVGGNNMSTTVSGTIGGAGGSLVKVGSGTLTLSGANTYTGGTTVNAGTLLLGAAGVLSPVGALTVNGGTFDLGGNNQTVGALSGAGGTIALGAGTLTTNSAANTALAASITGTGGLVKQGGGVLTLSGANSYSGGTTVSGGVLVGDTNSLQGNITNNSAVVFNQTSAGTYAGTMSGSGGLALVGGGALNLTASNSFTAGTIVAAGTLFVNGSLASGVFVNTGATLGGNGTIAGAVVNAGTLAPGNSIGLLTVNGSYTQAPGSAYQVELNAAGQNDRINITGAPGTATIQGGTVQVIAQRGLYARSTTYTIVNATGGVAGTYSGVTSNFEFFTPSLAYDANNVFLTLALNFAQGGSTPNEKEVGKDIDKTFPNATGDFATVIGVLASLGRGQGNAVLDALSGQQYANFGTMNVNNSAMFMNAIGQQMAVARGASAPAGQRLALAQACEVEACEAASRFSVWGSLLGGLGSVLGDGNASTLTYNFGGAAAGIDYRIDPRFLVGVAAGYTHGTQWVNTLLGQGWTNSASVAVYGSFTQGALYVDALAGYAYFDNELERQIVIPGLQPRTATGSTGANQFLGQVETGYKLDVYAPAQASVTPFGRLQISNVNQNGFTESGAQALSLNVAQQTTNSLRSVLGADFGSAVPLGNQRKLDLAVRLGWQHEFAYTGRPITAAFSGAPGASFTVYAATPQRDSAVVGLSASTTITDATQVYLRYDGEIASGTDNHAINVGVRFSW